MLISKKSKLLMFSFVAILLFNILSLELKTNRIIESNKSLSQKREVTLLFLDIKYILKKLEETAINIALLGDEERIVLLDQLKINYIKNIKTLKKYNLNKKDLKNFKQMDKDFNVYYDSLVKLSKAGIMRVKSEKNRKKYSAQYSASLESLKDELTMVDYLDAYARNYVKDKILFAQDMIAEAIETQEVDGIEIVKIKFLRKMKKFKSKLSHSHDKFDSFVQMYVDFFDSGYKMAEMAVVVIKNDKKVKNEIKIVQKLANEYEININKITQHQLKSLSNISVNNKEEISSMQNIGRLTTLLISLGIIFLFFTLKSIVSSIKNFQNSLLEFFRYINKEVDSIKLLDDSSSDEIGLMSKVVNENIKKSQNMIKEDASFLDDVKRVVTSVKSGVLIEKIEKDTNNDSLNELKIIINDMINEIKQNVATDINKIDLALAKFKELDFTYRIPQAQGKTSIGLNDLANTISDMLSTNHKVGITLQDSSEKLLNNVHTLNNVSITTAASLEETAASLEEVMSSISTNTSNINKMSNYSDQLNSSTNDGKELANKTAISMNEINEQVSEINNAISVIDQISFQTNILSLNAAVEAATAGEAGKGFAVVAQEVRNLATRSADAANEIKKLVEQATIKANEGKNIASAMINGYEELNVNIEKTSIIIKDVVEATNEQQSSISQINDAISTLDQQTQNNATIASQTKTIANETNSVANMIVEDVNKKKFLTS